MSVRFAYIDRENKEVSLYSFADISEMITLIEWGSTTEKEDIEENSEKLKSFNFDPKDFKYVDALCAHFCKEFDWYFISSESRTPLKRNKNMVGAITYVITPDKIQYYLCALDKRNPSVHYIYEEKTNNSVRMTYEMVLKEIKRSTIDIYVESSREGVETAYYPRRMS